jgi:hypothetical protein
MAETARLFGISANAMALFGEKLIKKSLIIILTPGPLLLTLLSLRTTGRRVGGFPSGIEQS